MLVIFLLYNTGFHPYFLQLLCRLKVYADDALPQISISPAKISFNTQQMLPYSGVRCSKAVFMTLT